MRKIKGNNEISFLKLSIIIVVLFYSMKIVLIDFNYNNLGNMSSTFSLTLSPLIAGIIVGILVKIAINTYKKKNVEDISASTYLIIFLSYIILFIAFILFAVYFDTIVIAKVPGYPIWFIFAMMILIGVAALMFMKIKHYISEISIEDE